jgi:PAS domain S-box-containing protein
VPFVLLAGLVGPLLFSIWYTVRIEQETLEASFNYELERLADVLADGMSEPIWNLIPESGAPLANSMMKDQRILALEVTSLAQNGFLRRERPDLPADAEIVLLTRDVLHEGAKIGAVALSVDARAMRSTLEDQQRRIVIAGAVGMGLSLAFVLLIFRFWKRLENERILMELNRKLRTEVVERRQAEEALRESEGRVRGILEHSPAAIFLRDLGGRFRVVNSRFLEWYGVSEADVIGQNRLDIFPKEAETLGLAQGGVSLKPGRTEQREIDVRLADGEIHRIAVSRFPVRDAQARIVGVGTVQVDVTGQRAAEEKLRQSQKLQALGQLTGGVAHDFNNLLAVIVGNAEMLEEDLEGQDGYDEKSFQAIKRAALRGTELTQRLLAFSRRQPLSAQPVDMRELTDSIAEMLRRTLGEAFAVEMSAPLDVWPALVDAGQLENALLNLAINARDAMPGGGRLTIDVANETVSDGSAHTGLEIEPGDYIAIIVTDNGVGMAPETVARAVEPFFTTKDVGSGSGLGLSMVYGFVKQSGGGMAIESAPGEGTRVTLFLPRAMDDLAAATALPASDAPQGAGETILLVEDDVDVRELAETELRSMNYRVLAAVDARRGLEIVTSDEAIDLLLTDVILPDGMTGPELAEEALALRPGLKVLFMSGYAETTDGRSMLPDGAELLSKPFAKRDLARRLRGLLDAPAGVT